MTTNDLSTAIIDGDYSTVQQIMDQTPQLASEIPTLLHLAVQHGSLKLLKLLIPHGSLVATDDQKNLPLHLAVQRQQVEMVNLLLLYLSGADIYRHNASGLTPVRWAYTLANSQTCKTDSIYQILTSLLNYHRQYSSKSTWGGLLSNNRLYTVSWPVAQLFITQVPPSATEGLLSTLEFCTTETYRNCSYPAEQLLHAVLDRGLDDLVDSDCYLSINGHPLIVEWVRSNYTSVVSRLLQNNRGLTILKRHCGHLYEHLIQHHYDQMLSLLLKHGCDPKAVDELEVSALSHCVTYGRPALAGLLAQHGVIIDQQLSKCIETMVRRMLARVKYLLADHDEDGDILANHIIAMFSDYDDHYVPLILFRRHVFDLINSSPLSADERHRLQLELDKRLF